MTYIGAVILAFCILAVVEYLFRNVVHRGEIVHYVVLFALGSIGYAFAMMVMLLSLSFRIILYSIIGVSAP